MRDEDKISAVAGALAKQASIRGGILNAVNIPASQFLDNLRRGAPKTYREYMEDAAAVLAALERDEARR